MSVGHQAHRPENLQHRHFGLDVLCPEALWDGVDALWVGQDMCAALGVVHQGLDAANDGGVDTALWRLVVHAAQEVEEAGEAVELNEARDESGRGGKENKYIFRIKLNWIVKIQFIRTALHCYS